MSILPYPISVMDEDAIWTFSQFHRLSTFLKKLIRSKPRKRRVWNLRDISSKPGELCRKSREQSSKSAPQDSGSENLWN